MREMKFRGWSLSDKKMYEPVWFDNLEVTWFDKANNEWTVLGDRWPNTMLHQVIVEQFTGLKDSKGVDIYEGDIVDNIVIWGDEFGSSPVIFKDGCFGLDVLGSGHRRYEPCLYEADSRYITVIGNIHETTIDEARDKS